ncbi:transcription factor S-II-domain-containing protein [Blastocladiella britannica]|nr:transcription factor S-II-domain-containing protein [Blastocladiella britannica]
MATAATVTTVLELKSSLQSALEKGKHAVAADVLNHIGAAIPTATKDLLRQTDIGIVVGKLRKHADPAVAAASVKLLDKWKRDVGLAPPSRSGSMSSSSGLAAINTTNSRTSSAQSTPVGSPTIATAPTLSVPSLSRPGSVGSAAFRERSVKLDGVDLKPPEGDEARGRSVQIFYNVLCIDTDIDATLLLQHAYAIEAALLALHSTPTAADYKSTLRQLMTSLKRADMRWLRESVLGGDIAPAQLVSMRGEELASKDTRDRLQAAKDEALFKARAAGNVKAVTDQFRCGKCKKRKCSYFQMQTRSADEPMTTFVECLECGNNWKFC